MFHVVLWGDGEIRILCVNVCRMFNVGMEKFLKIGFRKRNIYTFQKGSWTLSRAQLKHQGHTNVLSQYHANRGILHEHKPFDSWVIDVTTKCFCLTKIDQIFNKEIYVMWQCNQSSKWFLWKSTEFVQGLDCCLFWTYNACLNKFTDAVVVLNWTL